MLIHIVRYNEKISDILENYKVTYDELKVNNLHVSDLNNLIGGTKLKIPFLNENTLQILETTEPFISDYYPSVNKLEDVEEKKEVLKFEEELIEKLEPRKETKGNDLLNVQKNINNSKFSGYSNFTRRSIYPFYKK